MQIETRRIVVSAAPTLRLWTDVLLVAGGGLALLVLIVVNWGGMIAQPLRVVLGLLYVLYVPGYCLTVALFPRSGDIDTPQRLGLNVGLSIALVPILVVVLDRLPWEIRPVPILVAELAVSAVGLAVACSRRTLLPAGSAYLPRPLYRPAKVWSASQQFSAARKVALSALLVAAYGFGWAINAPRDGAASEFYVLGAEQLAEAYPTEVEQGSPIEATLGIVNREREPHRFHVETWVSDPWSPDRRRRVRTDGPFWLNSDANLPIATSWSMPWVGDGQQVDLLLFMDDSPVAYRRLRMSIDVVERGESVWE